MNTAIICGMVAIAESMGKVFYTHDGKEAMRRQRMQAQIARRRKQQQPWRVPGLNVKRLSKVHRRGFPR